jgi:hypothetical protein
MRDACPVQLIFLDVIEKVIFTENKTRSPLLCNLLQASIIYSLSQIEMILSVLSSLSPSMCILRLGWDKASRPCKATDEIIVLYIINTSVSMQEMGKQHIQKPFQILSSNILKMVVFWVVAPCSQVEVYRRFRGVCYLYHQDNGNRNVKFPFTYLQCRCAVTQSDVPLRLQDHGRPWA